jgi:hypothetical protein
MSEPSNDIVAAARIPTDHPRGRDPATRSSAAIPLPSGRDALPGCELAAIALAVARQASSDAVTLGLAGPPLVGSPYPSRRRRASARCAVTSTRPPAATLARRGSAGRRRPTRSRLPGQGRDPRTPRSRDLVTSVHRRPGAPTCSTSRRSAACSPASRRSSPPASASPRSRSPIPPDRAVRGARTAARVEPQRAPAGPRLPCPPHRAAGSPAPPTPPPSAAATT